MVDAAADVGVASVPVEIPSGAELIKSVGPRLMLDILGPALAFYAAWKGTGDLLIGVAVGTAVSISVFAYERVHGRPGLIAQVVLGFVLVQAVVGVTTDSATAYLIGPALLGVINGALWLGSVALHRPLAAVFASEVFPIDDETRAAPDYLTVFTRVSLWFGVFFVVFASVQITVLLIVGVGAFVATRVADVIGILVMIVFCVHYVTDRLAPAPSAG